MAIDRTRHERINIRNCARMLISPKKSRFLLWRAARACSFIPLRTSAEVCSTQTKATFFRLGAADFRAGSQCYKGTCPSRAPKQEPGFLGRDQHSGAVPDIDSFVPGSVDCHSHSGTSATQRTGAICAEAVATGDRQSVV